MKSETSIITLNGILILVDKHRNGLKYGMHIQKAARWIGPNSVAVNYCLRIVPTRPLLPSRNNQASATVKTAFVQQESEIFNVVSLSRAAAFSEICDVHNHVERDPNFSR